ncbi:MAG: glutamate racemase [Burkholderiales bacterium]
MNDAPIGVFDSGVGGLSVLREIRKALPNEALLYVADSGAAPYGDRPREYIAARARAVTGFFLGQQVKAVVVACNTATAVAAQMLRSCFDIPIVAMEPAVKPAAERTRSGVIGVMATSQTLASEGYSRLTRKQGAGVEIISQPCNDLVALVENAELTGPRVEAMISRYIMPLLERGADTLVLGCTHYAFLAEAIKAVAGPNVIVLDPAAAVAKELRRRLEAGHLLASRTSAGGERFWTSGSPAQVQSVIGKLWGEDVDVRAAPVLGLVA